MGILDRFAEILHESDDDDFDDFYEEKEPYGISAPEKRSSDRSAKNVNLPNVEIHEKITRARADSDKIVNIHTTAQLQVVLVKPNKFEEAAAIGDNLNLKRTVVLNLESTNRDIARRLLDFLSGVAYANGGSIQRVANSTYIITPYYVDVMGDLIDELENNGMFT